MQKAWWLCGGKDCWLGQSSEARHEATSIIPNLHDSKIILDRLLQSISISISYAMKRRERGYHFDRSKLGRRKSVPRLKATRGQLRFELEHLKGKLARRDRRSFAALKSLNTPTPHPLFRSVRGDIEDWEKDRKIRTTR